MVSVDLKPHVSSSSAKSEGGGLHTDKHVYILDPTKLGWADFAAQA